MNRYEDDETIIRWLKIEGAVFKDAATIKEFSVTALATLEEMTLVGLEKENDKNTNRKICSRLRSGYDWRPVLFRGLESMG